MSGYGLYLSVYVNIIVIDISIVVNVYVHSYILLSRWAAAEGPNIDHHEEDCTYAWIQGCIKYAGSDFVCSRKQQQVGVWISGHLCWCSFFLLFWDHNRVISNFLAATVSPVAAAQHAGDRFWTEFGCESLGSLVADD